MATADFHDRLKRIDAAVPSRAPMPGNSASGVRRHSGKKRILNHGQLFLGALLMSCGMQFIRMVNENYEMLRDGMGFGVFAIALASLFALVAGAILTMRAIGPRENVTRVQKPQASPRARNITGFLGLAFGAIAIYYLFLVADARLIDTDTARTFMVGGFLIAFGLALLSLLTGFAGLFIRGRALGRVPLFFVLGAAICYAFVQTSGVSLVDPQLFHAYLQR